MESPTIGAVTQDDREWELDDEELDRSAPGPKGGICSRPCVCQQCSSPTHCR